MEIDTWYKWTFVYFYNGGGILLLLTSFVLAWKLRNLPSFIAALGMVGYVFGVFAQASAQNAYIEAQQTFQDQSGILSQFYVWRLISSVGFVSGGAALLWLALKSNWTNS